MNVENMELKNIQLGIQVLKLISIVVSILIELLLFGMFNAKGETFHLLLNDHNVT